MYINTTDSKLIYTKYEKILSSLTEQSFTRAQVGSKQVPLHATPVTVFQHPIKLSHINLQFQIMFSSIHHQKEYDKNIIPDIEA